MNVISLKLLLVECKTSILLSCTSQVILHKDYPSRVEFDDAINEALTSATVDIVCLAGFMRILSGEFTRKWKGKLLNVHPALLPSFKGIHAQRQALESGARITGCTVHFVEVKQHRACVVKFQPSRWRVPFQEDVDSGAIIVQEAVPILVGDTEETLTERIKLAEHRIFPEALRLLATGKIKLGDDNKLVWI